MTRVNVREDYRAFLRAKVTPGVRYDGDYAILPPWEHASQDIADALTEHAPHLHEYQRFAVTFAVARGRAALFLECGLGKTSIALAWSQHVRKGRPAVVCAPLAALHEFVNERDKFFPGVPLRLVATAEFDTWLAAPEGIALVTHHAFVRERDLSGVTAFVLDESSILKSGEGAIALSLVRSCRSVRQRLALSATPAPNDPTEYATHSTFLGYMRSDAEFRARFFVRDGTEWRVKGHAREALPRWLSRFALWMRDPATYGMPCDALPPDTYDIRIVPVEGGGYEREVELDLFGAPAGALDMSARSEIRSALYENGERTRQVVEICRGGPTVVWALRNRHADALERALGSAGLRVRQIAGTTPDDERVEAVRLFQAGELDALVSKPKVIGHGVNLQRAERMVFAGYDESYEAFHQAVRRAHRQGRVGTLQVYVMASPEERPVIEALERKGERWRAESERQEREFARALEGDIQAYRKGEALTTYTDTTERLAPVETDYYRLIHGDSIEVMGEMEPESVDLAVFSPPFAEFYAYSSETADMGNCSDGQEGEFYLHLDHFARRLHRVMKPGRAVCFHLSQLTAFQSRHGRKGIRDFRGKAIETMEAAGFWYYGEFVVPKNPQASALRTKTYRLQFTQLHRDSLECSPALNDYILHFRRAGEQVTPVKTDVTRDEWIEFAAGVWAGIRESDTLSVHSARSDDDQKHICPLQLTVIERCVRLWSNPGEVVFTAFAGIGSEIFVAIKQRRFGLGIELKAEYFRQAVQNADRAVTETHHQTALGLGA